MYSFPKSISVKWNANSLIQDLNLWVTNSISYNKLKCKVYFHVCTFKEWYLKLVREDSTFLWTFCKEFLILLPKCFEDSETEGKEKCVSLKVCVFLNFFIFIIIIIISPPPAHLRNSDRNRYVFTNPSTY